MHLDIYVSALNVAGNGTLIMELSNLEVVGDSGHRKKAWWWRRAGITK